MTFQFGQDLEMDQLRTNHNISKIFTTPFGKKEGCETTTNRDDTREAMSLSIPQLSPNKSIRSHGFSLKIRQARRRNILNTSSRLLPNFPDIDACLSNSTKFNKGGIKNGN